MGYIRTNNHENDVCGIYKITNKLNGKMYIGQACNIHARWIIHRSELNCQTHHNSHLQNTWNKYGEDSFKFEIIEECSVDKLDEREIYWIDYYDALNNGYNLSAGGCGCKGYKHSEEEIEKMRAAHNPDKVYQLDKELNIIKKWDSVAQASKTLNIYALTIRNCCNQLACVKSAGGFVWIYEKDFDTIDKNYYIDIKESEPKKVGQFDYDMNLINTYESITAAAKAVNGDSGTISMVCNHVRNRKSYRNFVWAFIDENNEIIDKDEYDYNVKRRHTKPRSNK